MNSVPQGTDTPGSSAPPTIQRPKSSQRSAYVVIAVIVVATVLVGGAYAGGLFGKTGSGGGCAPPSVSIVGAGSTLVYPLMYFWSTSYHDASINYNSVGSGAGISGITGKTVDFGASDAPLNPLQRSLAPGVMMLPESAGAVVPIYNVPGLLKPIQFTGQVLAKIYMGNITNWDDPALTAINTGITLPNATITPVHRADGSGTTFIFSSFLSLDSPTFASIYGHSTIVVWPQFELASKGNTGVAATVQTTPDSIGYVDINYAASTSIAYGSVQNPAGNFILANVSNSASALTDANPTFPAPSADWYNFSVLNAAGSGDYPVTSFTYVLIYKDSGTAFGALYTPTKAEDLVDFLWWAVHTGQQDSRQLFYIPLPAYAVAYDENELKSITYNGAPLSVCTSTS